MNVGASSYARGTHRSNTLKKNKTKQNKELKLETSTTRQLLMLLLTVSPVRFLFILCALLVLRRKVLQLPLHNPP